LDEADAGIDEVSIGDDEPPASPGQEWELQHWAPKEDRKVVTLEGAETFVGRDRGELSYPHDHYLSKSHGRFYTDEEGRLCVEDLGTLNGVFVRVRAPIALQHRDVLHIGRHTLRFEMLSSEEEDPRTMEGDPFTQVMGVQGSPPRARLIKRQDDGFNGTPFFFGVRKYVLGRSEGTHRFTKDDRMSRRHASLTYRDGEYMLEDLGSQNGTFIQIHAPQALERGDVVKMGDQLFKVL
ncbi:MAG: FHA domain-containing protein, partial [Planctomycetota bacterium]